MKLTVTLCLGILVFWAMVALCQLWFTPLSALAFVKLSITAGILDIVILVIGLCRREYCEDRDMKKGGYLD